MNMDIKFGLKLWSTNTGLIDSAIQLIDEKTFDYVELLVIPGTQRSPFSTGVPYIIHIPHHQFGVSIGDTSKKEYSLQKINESMAWADELDAEYLILHAGDGSIEYAANFLHEIADKRFLIENMPRVGPNGEKMIGYLSAQIKELIAGTDAGLCLDFGHAVKAATSLNYGYKDVINDFLKLKPKLFHISDGDQTDKDDHLDIGTGSFDIKYFNYCIENNQSKLITLETPRGSQVSLDDDLENISILRSMWDL